LTNSGRVINDIHLSIAYCDHVLAGADKREPNR
jgi:hypothetical protein